MEHLSCLNVSGRLDVVHSGAGVFIDLPPDDDLLVQLTGPGDTATTYAYQSVVFDQTSQTYQFDGVWFGTDLPGTPGIPPGTVLPASLASGTPKLNGPGSPQTVLPLTLPASTAGGSGLNYPLGAPPTVPQPGDLYPVPLGSGAPTFVYEPGPAAASTYSFVLTPTGTPAAGSTLAADGAGGWTVGPPTGGSVTTFSAGNLSPLFTSTVVTPTTTPALSFALATQAANLVFAGPATGSPALPTFRALSAADLTAAATALAVGGTPVLTAIPTLYKITLNFNDPAVFVAALTSTFTLFNLPAKGEILAGSAWLGNTAFTGGGLSNYTCNVGIASQATRYYSALSLFSSVATYALVGNCPDVRSSSASTIIQGVASGDGAHNLNVATAGTCDFLFLLVGLG